jgi:hypothetical protein
MIGVHGTRMDHLMYPDHGKQARTKIKPAC